LQKARETTLPSRANVTILCASILTASIRAQLIAGLCNRRQHEQLEAAVPIGGKPLTTFISKRSLMHPHDGQGDLAGTSRCRRTREVGRNRLNQVMMVLPVIAALAALPVLARSQELAYAGNPSAATVIVPSVQTNVTYERPAVRTRVNNYIFDTYGPYPIVGAGLAAGINQLSNAPPEWGQGAQGYGKRIGSDFGIAGIGTTARYGLAEAFKEDTLYYRCECSGLFPRLRHAMVSTLTARRGQDGHLVFSFPALVAPYAGSMTAVYTWFPSRYGAKDAFRIGNYNMLAYMGGNITLEFFDSGTHSLLTRMHLNNKHGASASGPNQ
jgi:hypothetical protein